MAEEQEEIIIIEDSDASSDSNDEQVIEKSKSSKNIIIIAVAGLLFLILIIIISVLLLSDDEVVNYESFDDSSLKKEVKVIEPSNLEKMIAKANYLYANGNKDDALKLYENIAIYSEAISQYNLAVAQLKESQYETALETFKLAIKNGENRCVSAINAAVCSLHLNQKDQFDYYIDLAFAYLPQESDSKIYSYYYALINYYKQNYFEALSALSHPSSPEYKNMQEHLKSKLNAYFGNFYASITSLEENYEDEDAFSLGLMYANVGDLTLAKKYVADAITQSEHPVKEQLALAYLNLKSGMYETGGSQLRTLTDMYNDEVYGVYPIHVNLKKKLFDPTSAQDHYRTNIVKQRSLRYQKIFYFSPYKIFNATQTISYIRKGNANIFIDDISSAKEYLKKSANSSKVNFAIAQAIKKSLSFHLEDANAMLKEMLKKQPKHSILHYNLALTYAQMGDMINAHKYFLRSYHLDANNYLSGIYAIMTSTLINKENKKLYSIIKDNLYNEKEQEEFELYRTLLAIANDDMLATVTWLEKDYKERPLYLMLNILIATEIDRKSIAAHAAQQLSIQLPHDILPHLLYVDTHFNDLDNKAYSRALHSYMKKQTLKFDDLYYGPYISRYLYSQVALMRGTLFKLRTQLKEKLVSEQSNPKNIINALALASIYDQDFEEAYIFYNQLIDEYKMRDSITLFSGAIASVGAQHHANAIALLELAKLKNKNNLEARYGLGLLYLESENHHGAGIQFGRIGNSGFMSQYFNFSIDTNKILAKRVGYK